MGFGRDLDLTDILPAYREHMTGHRGTATINFVDADKQQARDPFDHDAIPSSLYAPRRAPSEDPWRMGDGPRTCSTRTTLVPAKPTFAWDVNGWYRTIGVPWPYVNATAGALSKAFIASGGHSSARATYCLTELLNRAVRGVYDTMALGETYLDDRYVQDEMKAKAQMEASRRSNEGVFTEAVAVLDEWGYLIEDEVDEGIDTGQTPVQDSDTPESAYEPTEWTYAYWLWKSHGGTTERLEQWQALLVSALSARGANVNLAVGVMGRQPHDYAVGLFDGHWIVFLNDSREPTQEMAAKAAEALMHDMQHPI